MAGLLGKYGHYFARAAQFIAIVTYPYRNFFIHIAPYVCSVNGAFVTFLVLFFYTILALNNNNFGPKSLHFYSKMAIRGYFQWACEADVSPFPPYISVVSRQDTQAAKISNIDHLGERGFIYLELFDIKMTFSNDDLSYGEGWVYQ